MQKFFHYYKLKFKSLFNLNFHDEPPQIECSSMHDVYNICKSTLIYVAFLSLVMNLLTLIIPIYTLQVFDRVLRSQAYDTLIFMTFLAGVILFVYGCLSVLRSQILVTVSHAIGSMLTRNLLENSIEGRLVGSKYTNESLKDLGTIRNFFYGQSAIALYDSPWIFIFLLVMLSFNFILGFTGFIAAVFLYSIAYLNEKLSEKKSSELHQEKRNHNSFSSQILDNAPSIVAMGMVNPLMNDWEEQFDQISKNQVQSINDSGVYRSIVKVSRMMIQVFILGLGAALVVSGEIAPGAMIAASILISRALAPIEQVVNSSKQLTETWNSFHRLNWYLKNAPKLKKTIKLPKPEGKLSVENIRFAYPNTKKAVLQGVSFSVNPGEILVIAGPNGSGKSTLAEVLLGIYKPISGIVRLDGADVFQWQRGGLGEYIGYLSQSLDLFSGSLKQNIARMKPGFKEEQVILAAKNTFLHKQFLQFPNGYDSILLNKGDNYSVGQKQKIAIARAFYNTPKLLVLDEPTAHLDSDGIQSLLRALKKAKKSSQTIIVISHHPILTNFADKLLLLKNGRVKEFGLREEVVEAVRKSQVKRKSKQ